MENYSHRQILILICFAFADFCSAVCVSLQAPFYPAEAERKGVSATQYGLVFGVFQLTMFLVSPIYGMFLSAIGPTFVLSAGLLTTGTSCILFGFLDKVLHTTIFLGLSFTVRIIEALGSAAFYTASFTLIAKEFPSSVGVTFAALETCFGTGLIVGPTLGGGLYEVGGYSFPFLILGSVLVLIALCTCCVLPPDEFTSDTTPQESSRLLRVLKIPIIVIFVYAIIVTALSIGFLQATLEPHLRPFGLTPFQTGLMFIINGSMYAFSAPVWGILGDRYLSPRLVVAIGGLLITIAFLFVGPAPFFSFEPTLPVVIVALLCHGTGMGAELVATFSGTHRETLERGLPDNLNTYGLVSGIWMSSYSIGAFIGPTLSGYLFDTIGFKNGTILVMALHIIVFLAPIIFEICEKKTTNKYQNILPEEEERKKLFDSKTPSYGTEAENGDAYSNGITASSGRSSGSSTSLNTTT